MVRRGKIAALGALVAFFKTCAQSLFKFPSLVDHIRRPETTGDATSFALACAAMWAISIAIWDAYQYHIASNFTGDVDKTPIVDGSQYLVESALRFAAAFGATWVILKLSTKLFHSLLSSDSQRQIPSVLICNVFAYSLGASLLALLPIYVAGWNWAWVAAALWIIINAIIVRRTRLYLRTREAVVNVIIATVVCLFLLAVAYTACYFVEPAIYGNRSIYVPEPIPKLPMSR